MAEQKKRNSFFSLHRQLQVLIGVAVVVVIAVIILVRLSREPIYAYAGQKSTYDASAEIEAAKLRLGSGKAEHITQSESKDFKVQLIFEGVNSVEVTEHIIGLLKDYKMDAIFCASAIDAVESADALKEIMNNGYRLGSYNLRGEARMETLSTDELLDAFCTSGMVIKSVVGSQPKLVRCYHTEYTDDLLNAAFASGYGEAYDTENELDIRSFSSFSSVQRYVNNKNLGSIVAFRLSGDIDEPATDEKPPEAKPAVDKQETLRDEDWVDMGALSDTERAMLIAEWLIRANAEADYSEESVALRESNEGKTVPLQKTVYTTERATCFLYAGVKENNEELSTLLAKLKELDIHATFAVTLEEARKYGDAVMAIRDAGQDVELAVRPKEDSDYYQLCSQILLGRDYLSEHFSVAPGNLVVKIGYAECPALEEAASATNSMLLGYQSSIVQDKHADRVNADKIIDELFGTRVSSLMRGQVVYFAMNHYNDPGMLARVSEAVFKEKAVYPPVTLKDLSADSEDTYTYPVPEEDYLPGMDDIKPGHITNNIQLMDKIAGFYLGTPSARYSDNLPGFTNDERGRLNRKGLVSTKNRVIFLTVDDWGADDAIDPLLEVLKAHNAKATFFVRSNMVNANPNLLRTIAADGHEVGSHTSTHVALATDADGDLVYSSLTEAEQQLLRDDLIASWEELRNVIGDMQVNGRPALTKMFRPPTLSVSKEGMEVVFDLGFEYIVSGSFSSHDYETTSAEALYDDLRPNMKPGAVFVLHMSGNAQYTPEALDMLFTYNESLPASKRYEFPLLGDYLDGVNQVEHAY